MHPTARVVLSMGLALALAVARVTAQGPVTCSKKPIEPCVKRHGRLSTQNGITQRIWLIGTTRMVTPENDMAGLLPPPMGKYLSLTLPDHAYVYGDFEICPLEPEKPGHLRSVCVTGAEKLVVKTLYDSRPAFRWLSTWPPETRGRAGG